MVAGITSPVRVGSACPAEGRQLLEGVADGKTLKLQDGLRSAVTLITSKTPLRMICHADGGAFGTAGAPSSSPPTTGDAKRMQPHELYSLRCAPWKTLALDPWGRCTRTTSRRIAGTQRLRVIRARSSSTSYGA